MQQKFEKDYFLWSDYFYSNRNNGPMELYGRAHLDYQMIFGKGNFSTSDWEKERTLWFTFPGFEEILQDEVINIVDPEAI